MNEKNKILNEIEELKNDFFCEFSRKNILKLEYSYTLEKLLIKLKDLRFGFEKINECEKLITEVCKFKKIKEVDLIKYKKRNANIVITKHSLAYFLKTNFDLSFNEVGKLLNITHSSVMNICKNIVPYQEKRFEDILKEIKKIQKKII